MGADGSSPTNLTNNNVVDLSPAWSPDGSRFAFASNRTTGTHIWIMDASGANPTALTTGDVFQTDGGPQSWRP